MIITNTSPIYYLYQLNHLSLLSTLYENVTTTSEVMQELKEGADIGLAVPSAIETGFIKIVDVAIPSFLQLIPDLGPGESSVTGLALQEGDCTVILDDKLARQVALSNKINVTGTLGVLLLAKQQGLLTNVSSIVETLIQYGFFCSTPVKAEIKRLAGE